MSSKEIQEALNKEKRMLITIRRDAEQEEIVKKHKKKHKRDESLLEIHEKKLKKKRVRQHQLPNPELSNNHCFCSTFQKEEERKKKDEKPERRRFDRDLDLKANRFDDAQKKAVLKKAQLLDTRFSSGGAKFL